MLKAIIASCAAASALFLGCGIAHADSIDNAINAHSGQPGMVAYLHTARTLFDVTGDPDYIWNVGNVNDNVFIGEFYCNPSSPYAIPLADRKQMVAEMAVETTPLVAGGFLAILNQLCTNY